MNVPAEIQVPHDATAERAFVGGIIQDDGLALDELPEVSLDLFWLPAVRSAMKAILEQRAANAPCGLIGLTQYMSAAYANVAPGDGWGSMLNSLRSDGSPVGVLPHYLAILRGQLAMRRLLDLQVWLSGHLGPANDPAVVVSEAAARLAKVEPEADSADHALPGVVSTILREIDDINAGNEPKTLKTPLTVWNDAFGGLPAGAFLALGGRPGAGKSSMMEQIIFYLISSDVPVLLFEKDMSLKMLVLRLACRAVGVPFYKWTKGYTSRSERNSIREAVAYYPETKLRLHNPHGLTADTLAAIVRREQRTHGVQAVFLDHIQLLDLGKVETVEGLTRASTRIKASAHDTDIPHTVLFQINRQGASGRPRPEHVKGFDQLLSDVDGMAMLWTDQDPAELPKGQRLEVEFFAAKNRSGGPTGENIWFDGPLLTFTNGPQDKILVAGDKEPGATRPITDADFS